ncbi:MAG: (2Fe-2S) ferredoxin domain-containing protein, partial [Candidatus Omnitrophica bacterium]|nr:(2Fe-2S) ferredoxin domain-containing protein [Candidatus Omnitrophota bacterium]
MHHPRPELSVMAQQAKDKKAQYKHKICVCCGAGCISSGSEAVLAKLQAEIKARGLENEIEVVPTGCMGPCNQGPLVKIQPDQTIYQRVSCENI